MYLDQRAKSKPYEARVRHGCKLVNLGSFATAEEAALCVPRSPEGRAAAAKQAAPQVSQEEGKGTVPPMPPGAITMKLSTMHMHQRRPAVSSQHWSTSI